MEHIIGEYYECNGAIFRKLKLREGKCQIRTPEGKYMWVRPSDNTTFITRSDNTTGSDKCDNITKHEIEIPSDKNDNTTSSDITTLTTEYDNITGSDNTTSITESTLVQDTLDEVAKPNCTESTYVQGVQCTDSTEEHPDSNEGYGTIGDIERRTPRTPIRPYHEEEKEVVIDPEYGLPF